MAELELHSEGEGNDPLGKKIGIAASLIAVCLAVATIVSHRAHTEAVLMKSDANNKWAFYESKKIKLHSVELGEDIFGVMDSKNAEAQKMQAKYAEEIKKYTKDADDAQEAAREQDKEDAQVESRALRYDFGEGLLEIGLVLTSLYFISRSKLFPVVGGISAIAGILIALSGAFM
jgi:hypothetical protein